MMKIEDLLRKEISKSGKSRFQIAKETGITEAQLCRFMQGKTLTLPTAEILIQYFGYELKKRGSHETLQTHVHPKKHRRNENGQGV